MKSYAVWMPIVVNAENVEMAGDTLRKALRGDAEAQQRVQALMPHFVEVTQADE